MPPVIDRSKCIACGFCAEICPVDCLYLNKAEKKLIVRYGDECWHCGACKQDCPKGAITIRYPLSHMMLSFPPDKEVQA